MSKNRNRHVQKETTKTIKDGWPSWFVPITHPVEQEVLFLIFRKNARLFEIYSIIQTMQINYIVFRRNYEELVKLTKNFDDPLIFSELISHTQKGHDISQDMVLEFTRLLHNFLASAMTLVDITRTWVKKEFAGTSFLGIYQSEIESRFVHNMQAQFLKDLRNFTLHRTLPLVMPELRFQQVEENLLRSSIGFVLLKDHLLEWEKWSEVGRLQITQTTMDNEIDIQPILKQYFDNVTEFTRWLFWETRELFSSEVDFINSAVKSIGKKS